MSTYTYAILEVSKETFDEIYKLLHVSGYEELFQDYPDGRVIDMHGIGLKKKSDPDPDLQRIEIEKGAGDDYPVIERRTKG